MNKQSVNVGLYAAFAIFLAWTSIKLSLPALPTLGHFFHVSEDLLKLSISLLLFFMAGSQLVWGGISDNIGRRAVIITALIITAYGTLVVATSYSIVLFLVGRCIEGIGVGCCSPVGRAILSDSYDKKALSKRLAVYSAMAGSIPFLAPLIGSYLLVISWRAIFFTYLALIIIYLVMFYRNVAETRRGDPVKYPLRTALRNYNTILRTPRYWGYIVCYMFLSGPLIGYYASMPFWYITQWHLSEQTYAYLAIGPAAMNMLGLMVSKKLVERIDANNMLLTALIVDVAFALIVSLLAWFTNSSMILLASIFSVHAFIVGFCFPLSNVGALSTHRERAASVSALSASLLFFSASAFTSIESHLNTHYLWQVAALFIGCSITMLLLYSMLVFFNPSQQETNHE